MTDESKFKFNGNLFAIESCEIMAFFPDPYWTDKYNNGRNKHLRWSIEFKGKEQAIQDEYIAPTIDIDDMPIKIKDWSDLSGQSTKWNLPINPETDDRYGNTFVRDHLLINNCSIKIGKRDLNKFNVHIAGEDEESHTFELKALVPFKGINVSSSGKETERLVIKRLSKVININNLIPGEFKLLGHKYESGVEMASMNFSPKINVG